MIMIYAAAEHMPKILEEAPSFFGKHLNYLKDKYTEFFTHSNNQKMQIANVELVECDQSALVNKAHSQLLDRFVQAISEPGS